MESIDTYLKINTYIRRVHHDYEIMAPHSHNSWELIYCQKGSIEINVFKNNSSIEKTLFIHSFQFGIIKPKLLHNVKFLEKSNLLVLEIEELKKDALLNLAKKKEMVDGNSFLYKIINKLADVTIYNDSGTVGNDMDELIDCFLNKDNSYINDIEHNILLQKLLLSICKCSIDSSYLKSNIYNNKCLSYINNHLTEDISISDIAKYINITPSYLEKKFKESNNCSVYSYIREKRLQFASNLLLTTSLSYEDIARCSGFKNYLSLYRCFIDAYGCTIKEFKNNNQDVQFWNNSYHR